jgi:hypothetical protein
MTTPTRRSPLPSSVPCQRCGTCCRNGGPAFHAEDRHLIESGRIPPPRLVTLRAGEPVRDNVRDRRTVADADIIKLREIDGRRQCVCYDPAAGCAIYPDRPLECRVLDCRNTGPITDLYQKDRLTRRDLFSGLPDLWRLIRDHQDHCDYGRIRRTVEALAGTEREAALSRLSAMLEMDQMVRTQPVRNGLVPADWTDLLFGRPLSRTLLGFGLRVTPTERGFHIRPLASGHPHFSPSTPPR